MFTRCLLKYGLVPYAPIAQLAEAADLKSAQCRFESDWGHDLISVYLTEASLLAELDCHRLSQLPANSFSATTAAAAAPGG
jgi:hypothetical protein